MRFKFWTKKLSGENSNAATELRMCESRFLRGEKRSRTLTLHRTAAYSIFNLLQIIQNMSQEHVGR